MSAASVAAARGTRWDERAACRGRDDIDWFPSLARGTWSGRIPAQVAAPVTICAGCPVIADCLADVLQDTRCDRWGIRGGVLWRGLHAAPMDPLGVLAALHAAGRAS